MTREQTLQNREPQSIRQSEERPALAPACDIYENRDEILVVADLPGVTPENLEIQFDKGELTFEAKRTLTTTGNALASEIRECDYRRRFGVPAGIDGSKIHAELKDGVLHLHLPKSESLKPRNIAVRAG
jgi:HSP20 family molecular chaperone IbpA